MTITKNFSRTIGTQLVTIKHRKIVTSSLQVAEKFKKRHSDVIRSIEGIASQLPKNQCERIFTLTYNQVKQPNGGIRNEIYYLMNRDGFTLLAMGFTGKLALKFKLDYINAFNRMEKHIAAQKVDTLKLSAQIERILKQNSKDLMKYKDELAKRFGFDSTLASTGIIQGTLWNEEYGFDTNLRNLLAVCQGNTAAALYQMYQSASTDRNYRDLKITIGRFLYDLQSKHGL